ncbi:MAG: hypothetical protein ACKVT1_15980 [Dehalococcoidia bacterium]
MLSSITRHEFTAVLPLIAAMTVLFSSQAARAQEPPTPNARIESPAPLALFVLGRDSVVPVRALLPPACGGQDVDVALYDRDGARVLGLLPGTAATKATVSPTGSVEANVAMPKAGLMSAWPGVSGPCLKEPLVSQRLGIIVGVLDEAANGKDVATFVIPAASLTVPGTGRVLASALTARVDGATCATADTADARSKDNAGNVRIRVGGPAQGAACSRAGAEVTFLLPDGRVLFERRTFVPGVTQPYANLAPEAAPGTGAVPTAPATGLAELGQRDGRGTTWRAMVGLALLAVAAGVMMLMLTRRRAR